MAVDTPCTAYRNALDDWRRMRDVLAGQKAMRLNASSYLRRPSGLDVQSEEWAGYVMAAPFFEATLRTREGLTGLAFYRDPDFTLPTDMADFVRDVTQDGVSLRQFTQRLFDEILNVNRAIVVVDYPTADPTVRTQRDAELANRRPFLRQYFAEDMFYWEETSINGVRTLTQARMWEVETEKSETDEWATRWRYRIRVFELVQIDGGWQYQQRIFVSEQWQTDNELITTSDQNSPTTTTPTNPFVTQQGDAGANFAQDGPTLVPLIDGKPLTYLPVWVINATDQSPGVQTPPLLPLANTNISHFNTSAALENALFWCGNPTPYVCGVDPSGDTQLLVGSSKAWLIADADAKVDMLSYGADNLKPLENRLDRFEQHMAVLGARLLSPDKPGIEAAETARIHRQGEISVLAGICGSLSAAMADVCASARDWQGSTGTVTVVIHTTFYDAVISSVDATNFMKLWQQGAIAFSDLLALFKKGEIVDGARTVDQIAAENQSSPIQPQIMPGLTATGAAAGAGVGIPGQPSKTPASQE